MRLQAALSAERERATAALFDLSRDLAEATDGPAVAQRAVARVGKLLGTSAALWGRGPDGKAVLLAGQGTVLAGDVRETAVAQWVLDLERPAGRSTDTLPGVRGLHVPLPSSGGVRGVLAVDLEEHGRGLDPGVHQLLETMAALLGNALDRAMRSTEAHQARLAADLERTRSTLLSAVSHDLRTPLAGITGSAGVLLESGERMDAEQRRSLLLSIRDEGERLGRIVADLLSLTRLEAGAVDVRKEWSAVEELVHSALGRARSVLAGREVDVRLPTEVLLAEVDPVLIEQVLWNLLENAGRHTPAGTPIGVQARAEGDQLVVEVIDRGPGLAPGDEQRIFVRFHRARPDDRSGGAGLGLTLSRAIAQVHGGSLTAENREGGGALFRLTLPRGTAAALAT